MNAHKAREYFSAHYEGSIDRGLGESFERVLKSDAQVQAEYRAFCRTMDHLNSLQELAPEPPMDLHERIMAKLDLNVWEQKQHQRTGGFTWWKTSLVATAVLAVAAFGVIRATSDSTIDVVESNVVPSMSPGARLDVKPTAEGVILNYPRVSQREVIIRDGQGNEQERLKLLNQGIENKLLTNGGEAAVLVEIEIGNSTTWIAIPGKSTSIEAVGQGDLKQLALDIANQCRIPVIVQSQEAILSPWTIDSSNAHQSAETALQAHRLKVELRGDTSEPRMLWILAN